MHLNCTATLNLWDCSFHFWSDYSNFFTNLIYFEPTVFVKRCHSDGQSSVNRAIFSQTSYYKATCSRAHIFPSAPIASLSAHLLSLRCCCCWERHFSMLGEHENPLCAKLTNWRPSAGERWIYVIGAKRAVVRYIIVLKLWAAPTCVFINTRNT